MSDNKPQYLAAPPRVGDTHLMRHPQVNNPQPQEPKRPKIGLALGVAAVAGFLGGILWSKVKKEGENTSDEPEEPEEK